MLRFFLFGATGDLSIKKLYPALFELFNKNKLSDDVEIICIGRRDFSDEILHDFIADKVGGVRDVKLWFKFVKSLKYKQLAFEDLEDYKQLEAGLKIDKNDTHIFYLATAPQFFEPIVAHLYASRLLEQSNLNHRVVIEKPFGKDLESAIKINEHLESFVDENQIYRMDHYLGKEMIQNIMMLRFNNMLFEASWNKEYIDHVQITVAESYGVFERAGYYDKSGAIRDMIQSHLLQMLALVAMTPLGNREYEDVVSAKVEVLHALRFDDVRKDVVLGQYISHGNMLGYRQEKGVHPKSLTETFTAMKIRVDLPRWDGIDFYLRTGKRLKSKVSEIVIVYKKPTGSIGNECPPNTLTIQIHPQEGMKLKFNMKMPGTIKELITREMEFCQSCMIDYHAPEAYETLINEVVLGNHDLYTRWDEVKNEWTFVEKMLDECVDLKTDIQYYEAGSRGPKLADDLLARDGRIWYSL
jgi:glucose-6-phosphate 1-dehydrogenase